MPEPENFAEMFAQTDKKRPRLPAPGDKVSGVVISVGQKHAVLDLGGGIDGMIELIGLAEEGVMPQVGERIDGYVLGIENRIVNVARAVAKGQQGMRVLEQAKDARLPIEGTVSATNKGGYVVDVAGVRCFCPLGQMDLRRIEDPNTMLGHKLKFLVTELKGRDAVLSRRALLEEEQKGKREKTLAELKVGARMTGQVVGIRDFGAFVDLGGVDGLVPVSEMAWGRVKAAEVVTVGQALEVEVIRIEGEKISLSMRKLQERPEPPATTTSTATLTTVKPKPAHVEVGSVVEVTVDKIETFGLFVSFAAGRGLVPVNELDGNDRAHDLRKKYPVGTKFRAALIERRADGKMRLSKKATEAAEERAEADAFLQGQGGAGLGTLAEKLQKALKK